MLTNMVWIFHRNMALDIPLGGKNMVLDIPMACFLISALLGKWLFAINQRGSVADPLENILAV